MLKSAYRNDIRADIIDGQHRNLGLLVNGTTSQNLTEGIANVNRWKDQLIQFYLARDALATGTFQLASGGTSDFYIDGRVVTTFPPALRLIAKMFKGIIEAHNLLPGEANLVTPGGVSGIPIGTALALELDRSFVIDRGQQKAHGKGKRFEGTFSDNQQCLVVDDLATGGGTIIKTVIALREIGYRVTDALVVVDREEGGREELAKMDVRLHSLITKAELRAALLETTVAR